MDVPPRWDVLLPLDLAHFVAENITSPALTIYAKVFELYVSERSGAERTDVRCWENGRS